MLVSLEIRNFLLIKKLSINLIKGFNTFTGETGAGKSIIIDALKLALGGKNNSNHNLKDNEITTIKAVFEINEKIKNNLDSLNIEIEDDYLIVERQIDINQKSKVLLNNHQSKNSIARPIHEKYILSLFLSFSFAFSLSLSFFRFLSFSRLSL